MPGIEHTAWIYEDKQHFEFYAQSCGKAVVYLSENAIATTISETIGFEITFGAVDNTQIELRRYPSGEYIQTGHMSDVLTCHGLRLFWITWYRGELTIGTGPLFSRSVMKYSQQVIRVKTISLISKPSSDNSYTYWEFPRDAGMTPF